MGCPGPGLCTMMGSRASSILLELQQPIEGCAAGLSSPGGENASKSMCEWGLNTTVRGPVDTFCDVPLIKTAAWRMSHIFFFSYGLICSMTFSDRVKYNPETPSTRWWRVTAYFQELVVGGQPIVFVVAALVLVLFSDFIWVEEKKGIGQEKDRRRKANTCIIECLAKHYV